MFRAESIARGWHAKESRVALAHAVKALEGAQQPNGGWGHDDASRPLGIGPGVSLPGGGADGGDLEYPATLLASSHCALAALGVAHRTLGTKAPKSVERGRAYFADAQNPEGTFPYDPSQRHDRGMLRAGAPSEEAARAAAAGRVSDCLEYARTGGAAFALLCGGAPSNDAVVAKALASLERRTSMYSEGHGSATLALEYGALLCRARGDASWTDFRSTYFRRIVAAQKADGSFDCVCARTHGGVSCDTESPHAKELVGHADWARPYVTAIHVLILAMDRDAPKVLPKVVVVPPPPVTPK